MSATCVRCTRPMPDVAYACTHCASGLAETLTAAAGHAEDAEGQIGRQAQSGAGSRGGSSAPLPVDLTRSVQLDAVKLAVDGWVSVLLAGAPFPPWQRTIGPLCPPLQTVVTLDDGEVMLVQCSHPSCAAIRVTTPPSTLSREFAWLSGQMERLRRHPAADEAFRDLHDACEQLARLVDRPADKELVGMCDCGRVLYAPPGKTVVTCPVPTCRLHWDVERSRDILRKSLDEKLVTAAEAARLGQYLDTDRTQDNIGKLIDSRVRSGRLSPHGVIDGEPVYRFGEVSLMLATIPKRKRRAAA